MYDEGIRSLLVPKRGLGLESLQKDRSMGMYRKRGCRREGRGARWMWRGGRRGRRCIGY